jgi:hypothetical protein
MGDGYCKGFPHSFLKTDRINNSAYCGANATEIG